MTWWVSSPRQRLFIGALLVLIAVGGLFAYNRFFREQPAPYFASDEEHFLYGSVGTEAEQGVPYWIWLVLPRIFPEYLPAPGGYASIGVLGQPGTRCRSACRRSRSAFRASASTARCAMRPASGRRPTMRRSIYPAAASHQTGEQEYLRFLIAAASDPRFTADTILAEIAKNTRLSFMDRLLYRFAIIPGTRRGLLEQRDRSTWMHSRPDWGRGRIDPFNPVKFGILKQPIDETIGNSDMMPLWNLARRDGTAYHWDGLSTSLREVVQSSALGDGATKRWTERDFAKWDSTEARDRSSLRRVMNYIGSLPAPAYPFPIDRTLAATGAAIFKAQCAQCHEHGTGRTGTVIPLAEIGTDRHRADMWTTGAVQAYNAYGEGYAWKFSGFKKQEGYAALPLDGLWLTAPYLHNGSVPTLTDLLAPVAERPRLFWRGYDVYDRERLGFVTDGDEARRAGTPIDIGKPGNSNAGHTYGTTLMPEDKRALLEFLKTF